MKIILTKDLLLDTTIYQVGALMACRFGWHQWERWQTVEFANALTLGSHMSRAEQHRECKRCGLAKRRLIWS